MPSRRSVLAASATALSVGVAGCSDASDPPESAFDATTTRWPTAGYDPAATGHAPAGPDRPSVDWTLDRRAVDPPLYGDLSSPAVGDDTVYVAALASDSFPSDEDGSWLVALDRASGSVRWKREFPAGLTGAPALADGSVLVGGHDGSLHAVDEGEEAWAASLGGRVGTPTTFGDRVYVGTSRGALHALTLDGETHWTADRTGFLSSLFGNARDVAVGLPAATTRGVYVTVGTGGDDPPLLLAYGHGGSERWR